MLVFLGCLGAVSAWRAQIWADPQALWREATAHAPDSARAWSNRAIAELDAGDHRQAALAVARALDLDPQAVKAQDVALAVSFVQPPMTKEP